jgi:hypothetical protein
MSTTTQLQRQALGCGYEPRTDRVHLTIWQPPGGSHGYSGPPLSACAGYTCNLPDVMEAAVARAHWRNGALALLHPAATDELLDSVLVLDAAYNEVEGWLMTPADKGGGMRHGD